MIKVNSFEEFLCLSLGIFIFYCFIQKNDIIDDYIIKIIGFVVRIATKTFIWLKFLIMFSLWLSIITNKILIFLCVFLSNFSGDDIDVNKKNCLMINENAFAINDILRLLKLRI
jgi:hypothetical protein